MSKIPAAGIIRPDDYAHSAAHYAVVTGNHAALSRLVSSLPRLPSSFPSTEFDSLALERLADRISSVLDRRDDVPYRETPLHLAVRLSDLSAARTLVSAGADASLQNSSGWNPLQEAICRRSSDIALVLLQHHHLAAWAKWRRRLPRLVAALRRMHDFYMEMSFHFESSVVPFVGKIAPSDTYRIWKRDGNLRADTSLSGFDGLKIQRADQSFLFLADGDRENNVQEGSLLILNRDERRVYDAFETAGAPMTDADVRSFVSQSSVYRPGMDVTAAELVPRTNWRRQEKAAESVGEWKAKVYDVNNVVFSFRSRKIISGCGSENDFAPAAVGSEQVLPLELVDVDEVDAEEGFLVMENPNFDKRRHSSFVGGAQGSRRRHSSFVRDETEWITVSRKSVDINLAPTSSSSGRRRTSVSSAPPPPPPRPSRLPARPAAASVSAPATKEKEFVKNLKPSVWLTEQFPLKTEEILPLLDILANKVKAVRRMRELLTTKFPPGTFPVKIAIPVVPTVRVVITFTKFVELPPTEIFYTPLSSPTNLKSEHDDDQREEQQQTSSTATLYSLISSSSTAPSSGSGWLSRSSSRNSSWSSKQQHQEQCYDALQSDPFTVPSGYQWTNTETNSNKLKKSKSVRRSK